MTAPSLHQAEAVIAAGWTSPADHERAVRQARAEGAAAERERVARAIEELRLNNPKNPAARHYDAALTDAAALARAAQPEDARGGEQR